MDPTALGRYLRESRESRELTLEDAVRALRIRRDILESFEQGEFAIMDSAVRVRGMLRNYAHFLGLEEERVLQYYESAVNRKHRRRFGRREKHVEPLAPRKITDTPPALPAVTVPAPDGMSPLFRGLRTGAMILVSIIAIALIAFVLIDMLELNRPDEIIVVPSLSAGIFTATSTNTATITPRATIITDTPEALALNVSGIQVLLELSQRSWFRVLVDDIEVFAGIQEPGFSELYTGNVSVQITSANAAALDITYNGVVQNAFGARGQEVSLLFTATGITFMEGDSPAVATPAPLPTEAPLEATDEPPATASPDIVPATSTTIVSGLPTPTPLFPVADNVVSPTESEITAVASTVIPTSAPALTATPVITDTPQVVFSPTPTSSPTPAAVLPLRVTPSDPTATKTG